MEIYCKKCKKVLGHYPDEKIPPNIKGYTTCKLCGERIEIFREVKGSGSSSNQKNRLFAVLFLVFILYSFQDRINYFLLSKEEKIDIFHSEGKTLFNQGRYLEAREKWLKELELNENVANTWNNIGITYTFLEEYEEAIPYHEKAIEVDPRFGHAYYSLGRNLHFLKKYGEAQENYLRALELNYKTSDVYFSLATTQKLLNDCESAIPAYLNAIKFKRSYPWVHYFLGKCYESLNRFDDARAEYLKEAKLNADNSVASQIAIIEMDININPHNTDIDTYFELGKKYGSLRHIDDMNKSLDAFYNVLLRDPSYPSVHYEIGNIYKRMGATGSSFPNFKYAINEYEIELAKNPSHKNANSELKEATFVMKSIGLVGLKEDEKEPFDYSHYEFSDIESLKQKIDGNPVKFVSKRNSRTVKVTGKKFFVSTGLDDYPIPSSEEIADFLDYWVKNSKTRPDYHRFYSHELNIEKAAMKVKFLFNGLMIPDLKKEVAKGDAVEFYINFECYDLENNQVYLLVDEFKKKGESTVPHQYTVL